MNMVRVVWVVTVIAFLVLLTPPDMAAQDADVPDSADHAMISRYAGSIIDGYETYEYSDFDLPLGPAVRDEAGNRIPSEKETLEGKITRILYRGPEDRSTLEILRNYESAMGAAGFETLFSCSDDECGRLFWWLRYHGDRQIRTRTNGGFDNAQDLRYLAARRASPEGVTHVSLMIGIDPIFTKQPVSLLEIIESDPMDTDMVTVDAEAMAEGIDATGHIDLYGIYFDTDSDEIRPNSTETLDEITRLLESRDDLSLLVVGHTDSQGGYEHNVDLSQRRAEAVAAALVDRGIDTSRLRAAGVGFLAPVTTNDTEHGRALNRRVVLVKQ